MVRSQVSVVVVRLIALILINPVLPPCYRRGPAFCDRVSADGFLEDWNVRYLDAVALASQMVRPLRRPRVTGAVFGLGRMNLRLCMFLLRLYEAACQRMRSVGTRGALGKGEERMFWVYLSAFLTGFWLGF